MRTVTIALMVAIIAGIGWADAAGSPESVISRVNAEVERELAARGGGSGAGAETALTFDPLSRAERNLERWTSVPSREELVPRVPGGSVATMPGGLTREYFPRRGTSLVFPGSVETARAVRRMARGDVSSTPNYCARTMREALGWGLGDAHDWTALPSRGYNRRPRGTPAQPGDIVVWPFTYGSRNSQHIGVAVKTDAGMRLLSNLSGHPAGLPQLLGVGGVTPGSLGAYRKTLTR